MRTAAVATAVVLVAGLGGLAGARVLPQGPVAADPGSPTPSQDPDPQPRGLKTGANGDSVTATVSETVTGDAHAPLADAGTRTRSVAPPLTDYLHAEVCGVFSAGQDSAWPCSDGRVLDHSDVCGAAPAILPLWVRTRGRPADPWGGWTLLRDVTCDGGPTPSADQVLAAFARLPLTPSVLHVQPDRGWVLVNKETIAYVEPVTQTLEATVLGVAVTFVATPATYTWDYGERRFTTTSPGHPYPHQDVFYAYRKPGTGGVSVHTTWQATYTTDADPTPRPVPGTATTTTAGPTFDVVEVSAHLTRGDCTQYPDDPGC